jgi:hypothetical protein
MPITAYNSCNNFASHARTTMDVFKPIQNNENDRKVDREMQKIFSERNYEWILANYNLLSSKKIFRMWEQ